MGQQPQTYRFMWQGIDIEATYTPRKWGIIAHLESAASRPTERRCPSRERAIVRTSMSAAPLRRGGDVVAQLTAWLDEEAAKPEWQAQVAHSEQGELF